MKPSIRLRPEAAWDLAGAQARSCFRRGRMREALAALQTQLADGPDRAWLYALSGELKRSGPLSRASEALEDLERACALPGRAAWILGYRARALAQAARTGEALRCLDDALRALPGSPWLLCDRALLRLETGSAGAALRDAEAACRADASYGDAWLARALCLARLGRWPEAGRALERRPASRTAGPGSAGIALPDPDELAFEVLRRLGRFGEAADRLRAAASRAGRPSWAGPADLDEASLRERLAELDLVPAARARAPWLSFWRGELRWRLGDHGGADADLTAALAADPRHAWARAMRAVLRGSAGRTREALADAGRALPLFAGTAVEASLHELRGMLLSGLRRWRPAAAAYARAAALSPASRPCYGRAEAWLAAGRPAEAERELRRAVGLDPSFRPAYELRAELREARGDRAGAERDARRAAALPGGGLPAFSLPAGARASRAERPGAGDLGPDWDDAAGAGGGAARRPGARVDPLLETVGLLQAALTKAPVPEFCRRGAPALAEFVDEARGRFVPAVDAALLETFGRVARTSGNPAFPWLGVAQMMMGLGPFPDLEIRTRAWRDGEHLRLRAALRRFLERTRFIEFCESRAGDLARWTRPLSAAMRGEAYDRTVSRYLGVPLRASYDVAFSPLLRDVGLRAILRFDDGRRAARTVLCPLTSPRHFEQYAVAPQAEELLWTGWHELLHMAVDPWSAAHAAEAAEFEPLYARLAPAARRKDWMDCFSEHHVRAATQRLLLARAGPEAAARLAAQDAAEGYAYLAPLVRRLEDYERDRRRYPTLHDFIPAWLDGWREAAR